MATWLRPLFVSIFILVQTVGLTNALAADETIDRKPARAGATADADTVQAYLQMAAGTIRSTDQLAYWLAAGQTTADDIHALIDPLAKESKILPLIGLRNDEFYYNAQATGLRVSSYKPLVLTYQKQTWAFDAHATAVENHKKFMELFKTNTASSVIFSQLVPGALAAESAAHHYAKTGALKGAGLGAAGGAVLGLIIIAGATAAGIATAPVVLVVLGAAAIGAAAGAGYGYVKGKAHGVEQKASVDHLLANKTNDILKIECNDDRVQVSKQSEGKSVAVRFERIPPDQASVWQPIIDKIEAMVFGKPAPKNPETMKYFVATQFGANPAEVDVDKQMQKSNSSFEPAFFSARQGLALHVIESCKEMNAYIQACEAKNGSSDRTCAGPDINTPPDQYRAVAERQAACMKANVDQKIRVQMMCIPGQQIYGTYAGWKKAPAASGAGHTAQ